MDGTPGPREDSAEFDLSIFDQDVVWFDHDGSVYPIAQMTRDERSSIESWLLQHVRFFYLQVVAREVLAKWPTDGLLDVSDMPETFFLSAHDWLIATPLMVRLARPT